MFIENLNLILFLLFLGGVILLKSFNSFRQHRLIADTERSKTASAPQGRVELEGYVWPLGPPILTVSGERSVFRRIKIEQNIGMQNKNRKWVKVFDNTRYPTEFHLVDEGGAARIEFNPTRAVWFGVKTKEYDWQSLSEEQRRWVLLELNGAIKDLRIDSEGFRYSETSLRAGNPVYARGSFKTGSVGPVRIDDPALALFHRRLFEGGTHQVMQEVGSEQTAMTARAIASGAYLDSAEAAGLPLIYSHGQLSVRVKHADMLSDLKEAELISRHKDFLSLPMLIGLLLTTYALTCFIVLVGKKSVYRRLARPVEFKKYEAVPQKPVDAPTSLKERLFINVGWVPVVINPRTFTPELFFSSLASGQSQEVNPVVVGGKFIIFVYDDTWGDGDEFRSVDLWDLEQKKIIARWFQPEARVALPVGSTAGQIAAIVGTKDPTFKVWNRESQRVDFERKFVLLDAQSLQLSPDRSSVAFGAAEQASEPMTWYVWKQGAESVLKDPQDKAFDPGEKYFRPPGVPTARAVGLRSAIESANGRFAVGIKSDLDDLYFVDLAAGREKKLCGIFCFKDADLRGATLSDDGRWFFSTVKKQLWNTETGEAVEFPMDPITLQSYSPYRIYEREIDRKKEMDPEFCLTLPASCWPAATRAILRGRKEHGMMLLKGSCASGKREACAIANIPDPREGDHRPTASTARKREDFRTLEEYINFLSSPYMKR